jgi:SCAN domain
MAAEFQEWIKVGMELGLKSKELKECAQEKQNEVRADKLRLEEARRRSEEQAEEARRHSEELAEEARRRSEELAEEARRRSEEQAEKVRLDEMELKRTELENQKQVKLRELDLRMVYENSQSERNDRIGERGDRENAGQNNIKYVKMPVFKEDQDCLDAYLLRFERTCVAYKVPEDLWALTLVRSLEGKALEVYQRMDLESAQNYGNLKEELLKRFKLTEAGFRQMFKTSTRQMGETAAQFVERLRRYLRSWAQMAGVGPDHEGLEMLMLRDQFFMTCDDDMRRFLKEKGKISLSEMLVQAQNYLEARESDERGWISSNKHINGEIKEHKKNFEMRSNEERGYRNFRPEGVRDEGHKKDFQNGSREKQGTNYVQGREHRDFKTRNQFNNNWDFRAQRKEDTRGENKARGDYHYNSPLHHRPINGYQKADNFGKQHTIAFMQCEEEEEDETNPNAVISYCVTDEGRGEENEIMKPYISEVLVNGQKAKNLFDTGSSFVAIKQKFVRENQ